MGWHVPRLARDPCKVSGRVRFSSAPQKKFFENLELSDILYIFAKNVWMAEWLKAAGC